MRSIPLQAACRPMVRGRGHDLSGVMGHHHCGIARPCPAATCACGGIIATTPASRPRDAAMTGTGGHAATGAAVDFGLFNSLQLHHSARHDGPARWQAGCA
ncbi:hypothetical protein [Gluconacetobacter entanii]|nr:hypothetical protein [Gluconacetobacter entanii]MCE2578773.1 hypothetical protein [Komagataeibacter sp. FNDCR1]